MNTTKKQQVRVAKKRDQTYNNPVVARVRNQQKKERKAQVAPNSKSKNGADALLRVQGQRGTDIRSPQGDTRDSKKQQQMVAGSNSITPVKCSFYDRSVSYMAMGIVLKAISRGYKWTDSSFGDCPYYAFRYLIDIMKSAMRGTFPQIQQAPHWFWDILYAIKQKTEKFKTAQIKYSWIELNSGLGDDIVFSLGTGLDEYAVFWGVAGGSSVNGIPTLTAPPPYDPASTQGSTALNAMWSFYSAIGLGKLIADPGTSLLDHDTSSFAACYPEIGASYSSSGALKTTFYSERQIDSPILSKLAEYQETVFRGWQKAGVSAGSSSYTGARCSELSKDTWRNKTPPIFKFYNFDEFFEVLSLTLCLALENANANVLPNVVACPLTSLQAQIILRQALIPFFSNEFAQDVRLTGPNFIDMLPFTVGPNGSSFGRASMSVPTFLAENVRCVRRITHELNSPKVSRQVIDVIPVLARTPEKPQLKNYVYGPDLKLLYKDGAGDLDIDLIDCSSTVSGVTSYLDFNSEPVNLLVSNWNEWIQTLQTVLSPLVSLSPEPGVAALLTNVYTNIDRVQQPVDQPVVDRIGQPKGGDKSSAPDDKRLQKKLSSKEFHVGNPIPRKRMGAAPETGSSYFDLVGDLAISSIVGFNSALYPYISLWILPTSWSNGLQDASQQAYQTFQCEATFIERTSANGSFANLQTTTAYERHKMMAVVDVKAVTQNGNHQLIAALLEMDRIGGGGFFTSIASMIGDAFGVPAVRQIAGAVGQLTGL